MRDDPPTSSTASTSAARSPADATTRASASTVGRSSGPTSSSSSDRCSSTSWRSRGSHTGMVTDVSDDSASLASTQARRSCAMAVFCPGSPSCGSLASWSAPRLRSTYPKTASSTSMPPSRSMPSVRPSDSNPPSVRRRSTVASNVPPPRSYTAIVRPGARRSAWAYQVAAATGSGINRAWGISTIRSASRRTSRLKSPQLAGWVTVTAPGGPPSASPIVPTTQRRTSARHRSTAIGVPPSRSGVGSPTRRLNCRATRSGSWPARRSAASPTRKRPSLVSRTTVGTDVARYPSAATSARPFRATAAAV